MTPITNAANTTKTTPNTTATKPAPMSRDEVKKMLRDAAFVLQMTRRVKAEILGAEPETTKNAGRKVPDLAAGLGV
ncbi:MAG: hypothetical protein C0467_23565 [Planctomycetaceae bacterium]|nr:hypothetical protein [Planctomycetaceae bacterium]